MNIYLAGKKRIECLKIRLVCKLLNNLKIVLGSGGVVQEGWIGTDLPCFDITDIKSWESLLRKNSVSAMCAEHVWEHLSFWDGVRAIEYAKKFLEKDGHLRIAVPDGNSPDRNYIEYVRPGGHGAGSEDHKLLYDIDTMINIGRITKLKVRPLEYFDKQGTFHKYDWSPYDGFIRRSSENDQRNRYKKLTYTSLIVDFVKSSNYA